MLLISSLSLVNNHTGSTPYVTPPFGSVATSGTGMNGHVLGSIGLKPSNACDHVLGSIRLNACAVADATTNAVISMIEARARRILSPVSFLSDT